MYYHSGVGGIWTGDTEEGMPSDWEECRKKWNVKELTAEDLQNVFQCLIVVDYVSTGYPWVHEYDQFSSTQLAIDV